MRSIVTSLFAAVLFYLLTPNMFLRLPKNGSKMVVAATHAVIFGLIYYFLHVMVFKFFNPHAKFFEGLETMVPTTPPAMVVTTNPSVATTKPSVATTKQP